MTPRARPPFVAAADDVVRVNGVLATVRGVRYNGWGVAVHDVTLSTGADVDGLTADDLEVEATG